MSDLVGSGILDELVSSMGGEYAYLMLYSLTSHILIIIRRLSDQCFLIKLDDSIQNTMKGISKKVTKTAGRLFNTIDPLTDLPDYENVKKALYSLSPLVVEKDRVKAKRDARQHSLSYKEGDTLPIPIKQVLDHVRYVYLDEENDRSMTYSITYVASMYHANIVIPFPDPNTYTRLLINVGHNEVYHLERNVMDTRSILGELSRLSGADGMLDRTEVYMPENTVAILPPGPLSSYKIMTRGTPPSHKPPLNPYDPPTTFYRYPGQKITLVVDFIKTDNSVVEGSLSAAQLIQKADKNHVKEMVAQGGLEEVIKDPSTTMRRPKTREDEEEVKTRMEGETEDEEEVRRRMEGDE